MSPDPADILVWYEGKVALIETRTQAASAWLAELQNPIAARLGGNWVVEEASLPLFQREAEAAGLVVAIHQHGPTY
jgi:hypothetical protein